MRIKILALSSLVLVLGCAEGVELTGGNPSTGGGGPDGGTDQGGSPSTGGMGSGGSPSTGGMGSGGSPSTGGMGSGGSPSTGGEGTGGAGPGCGDGIIGAGEDCDGSLGGATCASEGFTGGTLACADDCSFDTSGCTTVTCGNGVINAGEVCDGANLNGQTCISQGFDGGSLSCNANCGSFNTAACTNTCTPVDLLTNGGFENGPNGGGWSESSVNFGSPVCDVASCGTGGGTGPFAGTYWVWIGGTNVAFESASVSRSVVIPPGTATLSFQFDLPVCEDPLFASDYFEVTIDGVVLFSATNASAECGAVGYQQKSFDISAYANGGAHTIAFSGATDDFIDVTNFFVDDVQLFGCQ